MLILTNKDHLMNVNGAVRDIAKHSDVSCFLETEKHIKRYVRKSKKTTIITTFSGALIPCVLLLLFLLLLLPCYLLLLSLNSIFVRKFSPLRNFTS